MHTVRDMDLALLLAELIASGADEHIVMLEIRKMFESEPRIAPWEVFEAEHGEELRAKIRAAKARYEKEGEQPKTRVFV